MATAIQVTETKRPQSKRAPASSTWPDVEETKEFLQELRVHAREQRAKHIRPQVEARVQSLRQRSRFWSKAKRATLDEQIAQERAFGEECIQEPMNAAPGQWAYRTIGSGERKPGRFEVSFYLEPKCVWEGKGIAPSYQEKLTVSLDMPDGRSLVVVEVGTADTEFLTDLCNVLEAKAEQLNRVHDKRTRTH